MAKTWMLALIRATFKHRPGTQEMGMRFTRYVAGTIKKINNDLDVMDAIGARSVNPPRSHHFLPGDFSSQTIMRGPIMPGGTSWNGGAIGERIIQQAVRSWQPSA